MSVNGQLQPACTECRAAKGECDLAEYCDGTDPVCPSDVYRRNTDSCTVNEVCEQSTLFAREVLTPMLICLCKKIQTELRGQG